MGRGKTRTHTLTVVMDCADLEQLLHRHDYRCLVYRLDDPSAYDDRDLAPTSWALGITRPGVYQVALRNGVFIWRPGDGDPLCEEPAHTVAIPAQAAPVDDEDPAAILDERCDVYDLPAFTCAHCRNDTSPQEEVASLAERRRRARNVPRQAGEPGTCARCRHPYGPREFVRPDRIGGFRPSCCWGDL